jgi:hypothetical protein
MIGHQRPGINDRFRAAGKLSRTINKILAVGNIIGNPALFDTSHNHMMQRAGSIQPSTTRYLRLLTQPDQFSLPNP